MARPLGVATNRNLQIKHKGALKHLSKTIIKTSDWRHLTLNEPSHLDLNVFKWHPRWSLPLQIPEVQFCSSLWPQFKSKITPLLWWSGVRVFSWTSVQCDIGLRRYHMRFMEVLELALAILFFTPPFLTAELSVPVWTFPCWPWGPVHRVQVMGSLVGGQTCLIWLLIFVSFPQETLEEEPVQVTGYTCNESNANSFYFKTVHLFICQMLSLDQHIHRYTCSLSVSRTPKHMKSFTDLSFSFIYITDEDLSMKWKCTRFR